MKHHDYEGKIFQAEKIREGITVTGCWGETYAYALVEGEWRPITYGKFVSARKVGGHLKHGSNFVEVSPGKYAFLLSVVGAAMSAPPLDFQSRSDAEPWVEFLKRHKEDEGLLPFAKECIEAFIHRFEWESADNVKGENYARKSEQFVASRA